MAYFIHVIFALFGSSHSLTLHDMQSLLLSVAYNPLSGTIPTQLGKLTRVRNLSFGSESGHKQGRIIGTLPTELGQLSTLEFFAISK